MTCVTMTQSDAAPAEASPILLEGKGHQGFITKFFERFHRNSYWSNKGSSSRSTRSKHPPACEAC
jgi:hypothetical protein